MRTRTESRLSQLENQFAQAQEIDQTPPDALTQALWDMADELDELEEVAREEEAANMGIGLDDLDELQRMYRRPRGCRVC